MKVLLINPPVPNILHANSPAVVQDETGIYPPLGLLYVAAYAEKVEDCSVVIMDCQAEGISHDILPDKLLDFRPDIVGILAMTYTLIDAVLVAKAVRSVCPKSFIVFGGPHPTIFPEETIKIPEVDFVIPGEGEYPFAELIKTIRDKSDYNNLNGVLTKVNPKFSAALKYIENLDDLLFPARHLINNTKYKSPLAVNNILTTIMSSRGCPARCTYCDRPQMGKKFRMRSAEKVVEELCHCFNTYGIKEFIFYDDTFTINKQRVIDICNLIIMKNLKISWDIRARIDTVTPQMLNLLKKAGCNRIHYGVESGSQKIQKILKKNLDINKIKEIFKITKKAGIEVLGYFMIGCPDENKKDLYDTFDLIKILPMDYLHITILTPFPGTEIYKKALEKGIFKNDYWREYALNPTADFKPNYLNQNFSNEELIAYQKKAYAYFYGRPTYILKRIFKIKSFNEFKRKSKLGLGLLKTVYSKKSSI